MAKRRQRIHRTREEWQRLIQEYEAGDQGPGEFCRDRRLSTTSFHYWRKKFREEATGDGPAGPLIELPALPASPEWRVELALGDGVVLRLR